MPPKAYYSSEIQQTTAKETAISIAIKQMMTMKTVFISYDSYGVYINEEQAIANIDAFAEKLAPHGYEYFVLDACWYMDGTFMDTYNLRKENRDRKSHIDQYGRFIESPELFPR